MKQWQRIIVMIGVSVTTVVAFPTIAHAASLYFSPSKGTFAVGDSLTVVLKVNAGGKSINASEGTVSYNTNLLQLKGVRKSGSVFTLWASEPSTSAGKISYSAGLPSPGFSGSAGTIIAMTFQAKGAGNAELAMSGGRVLANDGYGTNVLSNQGSASFTITEAGKPQQPSAPGTGVAQYPPPDVTSSSHPDQAQWYQSGSAVVSWTQPKGIRGISYELTDTPHTTPDAIFEKNTGTADLKISSEGVWYFHLRANYGSAWSSTVHYMLQFDATPPAPFNLELVRDRGESDPSPQVKFQATDAVSGITRYTMSIDDGSPAEVTSPATIEVSTAGRHTVRITAYDRANNTRESLLDFQVEGYPAPTITYVSSPIILLDELVVRGTAGAGDTVIVYVNNEEVGRVIAGTPKSDISSEPGQRPTWVLTAEKLFRPGSYRVSAAAQSAENKISVHSDAVTFQVTGRKVAVLGRAVATVAMLPAAGFVLVLFTILVIASLFMLVHSVKSMKQHERIADEELETLRSRINRGKLSTRQIDVALEKIEHDLTTSRRRKKPQQS